MTNKKLEILEISQAEAYFLRQCLPANHECKGLANRLESLFDPDLPKLVEILTERDAFGTFG